MTKYREILRLSSLGFGERNIALSCSVSRNTVSKVLKQAQEQQISWPLDASTTDADLETLLFPKDKSSATNKRMPDYAYIRKELLRNGVSKKLLWSGYCEDCHMAGEQVEVGWAGDPAHTIAPDTGEITNAWLFVGVMAYSMYAYVEAFINEKQKSWITAHVHMYEYFGGVTKILVPDNCTTAGRPSEISGMERRPVP